MKRILYLLIAAVIAAHTCLYMSGEEEHSSETRVLPIIMYHRISASKNAQGEFVVSPEEFENDLKYYKRKGYTFVFMSEVINFVNGEGTLPDKPIVISFDDGYYSDYVHMLPIVQRNEAKAVAAIIGYFADVYTGMELIRPAPHVTWDIIAEMSASGCVEIQNHSYNLHKIGELRRRKGERFDDYKTRIMGDIITMQSKITEVTGLRPNTMVYPFGYFNEDSENFIAEAGISASFSCESGMNTIQKGDSACLYKMKRLKRTHGSQIKLP